jgi:hypothetical protein
MKSVLIEKLKDAIIDCIHEGESAVSIKTAIKDAIDEVRIYHQTRLNKISEFDSEIDLRKANLQLTQEILKLRNEKNECTTNNGFNPNY